MMKLIRYPHVRVEGLVLLYAELIASTTRSLVSASIMGESSTGDPGSVLFAFSVRNVQNYWSKGSFYRLVCVLSSIDGGLDCQKFFPPSFIA